MNIQMASLHGGRSKIDHVTVTGDPAIIDHALGTSYVQILGILLSFAKRIDNFTVSAEANVEVRNANTKTLDVRRWTRRMGPIIVCTVFPPLTVTSRGWVTATNHPLTVTVTVTATVTAIHYPTTMDSELLREEVYDTFIASIRSVGTACTLAAVGIYLHRRNFVIGDGKRTLALISQQVTIPLLFFTKILYCNQDWSSDPCPDITQSLKDVWSLAVWPMYVVSVGLIVGWVAARISKTPTHQVRAVLAACAFGNATGLPITLLTVVSTNFPSDTDLGRMDPTLFLSIYLLLYPVLQWGIGGWLLAPEVVEPPTHVVKTADTDSTPLTTTATTAYQSMNVVSMKTSDSYNRLHRGMAETDASLYMSVPDSLYRLGGSIIGSIRESPAAPLSGDMPQSESEEAQLLLVDASDADSSIPSYSEYAAPVRFDTEDIPERDSPPSPLMSASYRDEHLPQNTTDNVKKFQFPSMEIMASVSHRVFMRCFQPPVLGALAGVLVASQPWLRGIFVDVVDRKGHAPLQFMFDGLYHVGEAAVPLNMMILGCNLSASYARSKAIVETYDDGTSKTKLFSRSTTLAIFIGKMIVMPIIGFFSAYVVREYYWDSCIPDDIAGGVYLVAMIVFLTPTANNIMVMVELSGSGSKEAMARTIAWQYALAPIVLSGTMTMAVATAVRWS